MNEKTDENINFFGLEIELWKIGTSPIAPKFNVVSKPNDWTRSVQRAAEGEMTATRQLQLKFWEAFRDYMQQNSKIRCQKPAPQHWMNHSIGRSGFGMCSIISTWDSEKSAWGSEIRVELVITDKRSKEYFARLEERQGEIEKAVGEKLIWKNPEEKHQSKVIVRLASDFSDEKNWPKQQVWLREKLEKFQAVFGPIVREL